MPTFRTILPVSITSTNTTKPWLGAYPTTPGDPFMDLLYAVGTNMAVLSGTGITPRRAFGTPTIGIVIRPTGIASRAAFGGSNFRKATVTLDYTDLRYGPGPEPRTGANSLDRTWLRDGPGPEPIGGGGSGTVVTLGTADIEDLVSDPVPSRRAFGTATISNGTLSPQGISPRRAFGSPTVIPEASVLRPSPFLPPRAFGTPSVIADQTISPSGFTKRAFGNATVSSSTVAYLAPNGIPSRRAFGTPTVGSVVINGIPTDGWIVPRDQGGDWVLDPFDASWTIRDQTVATTWF